MSAILAKMNGFFNHEKTIVSLKSRVYDKVNTQDCVGTKATVGKKICVVLKTAGALLASPFLAIAVMVDKVVNDIQFAVSQRNDEKAKGLIAKKMLLTLPLAIGMGLFYLPQGAIQQVRNAMDVFKKEQTSEEL